MWLYTVLLLGLICWLYSRWYFRKFTKVRKALKSDLLSLPIIGLSYMFVGNAEDRMNALEKIGKEAIDKGGAIAEWFMHRMFVAIADPEIAEIMSKKCLEKHDLMVKAVIPVVGVHSSIIAPVPVWRGRRKLLLPNFKLANLTQFVSIFAEESKLMTEILRPSVGQTISIFDYIAKYNMEAVCRSILGKRFNIQNGDSHDVIKYIDISAKTLAKRVLQPWLQSDYIYSLMPEYKTFNFYKNSAMNFVEKVIDFHMNKDKEQKDDKTEMERNISSLVEQIIKVKEHDEWKEDQAMREEIITVIIASTDTSAVGMSIAALMMARHPDKQEKVYQELLEIFEDTDRPVESDDLPRMKYLDAVINESLRLYSPVPIAVRQVDKEVTLPSGLTLPSGCGILIHLWAINRNPKYWGPDVEEFKPERFLQPLKQSAQFASFSLGPRNCIGKTYAYMSMKTMLATLLRKYRMLPAPETHPSIPLRIRYEIMMKESTNFKIRLQLREQD